MRERPKILILIAALYIISPIGNFFVNSMWSPYNFFEYCSIFFQPHNFYRQWPHLFFPMIAGAAIYAMKRWSFMVYWLCMVSLFVLSYWGYLQRAHFVSPFWLALFFIVNVGLVAYFLIPAVRNVYLDPRLRWWESKPRYHFPKEARCDVSDQVFEGRIRNISATGLFFSTQAIPKDGEDISIFVEHEGIKCTLKGHVICHAAQTPLGFGVRFKNERAEQAKLVEILELLRASGAEMIDRNTPHVSFLKWFTSLCRSGQGLIPSKAGPPPKKETPPSDSQT